MDKIGVLSEQIFGVSIESADGTLRSDIIHSMKTKAGLVVLIPNELLEDFYAALNVRTKQDFNSSTMNKFIEQLKLVGGK